MKIKKAQAALEFLTTYGWAFLVILVMIGALAYFGVLNPSGLLPSRCTFSPEVQCIEHMIDAGTDDLHFRFRNNVGEMANFTFGAWEINSDTSASCTCEGGASCQLMAGRIGNVTCSFPNGLLAEGDKIKFEVTANYSKASGSYTYPISGEIYGEAI